MSRYRRLAPAITGLVMMDRAKKAGDQVAFEQALKMYETEMAGMKEVMGFQEARQRMDIAGAKESFREQLRPEELALAKERVPYQEELTRGAAAARKATEVETTGSMSDILFQARQRSKQEDDLAAVTKYLQEEWDLPEDMTAEQIAIVNKMAVGILSGAEAKAQLEVGAPVTRAGAGVAEAQQAIDVAPAETQARISQAELDKAKAEEEQQVIQLRKDFGVLDVAAMNELKAELLKRSKLLGAEVEEQSKQQIDYYGRMPGLVIDKLVSAIGLDNARALEEKLSGETAAFRMQALEIAATAQGVNVPTLVAQDWLIEHGFDMTLKDYQSQLRILSTAAGSLTAAATTKEVYDEIAGITDLGADADGMGMLAMLMGASNRTLSDAEKQTAIRRLDNHIRSLVGNAKNIHASFDWDAFLTNLSGEAMLGDAEQAAAARALVGETVGK